MTLLQLCEPLLLYVCRLNRSARKGGAYGLGQVRGEIKGMLEDVRSRAAGDPNLVAQYEKTELVLLFFVDFMIKESRLSFAKDWDELAYERDELAGDEKFFDILDETLADKSKTADEQLSLFYTCMGLGFTGWYTDQPEYIREKMLECSSRIRTMMDADENSRVCPEAYEHVDTSDLVQPPGGKLIGIAIALVGLIIVLFVANFFAFQWSAQDLSTALRTIIDHGKP